MQRRFRGPHGLSPCSAPAGKLSASASGNEEQIAFDLKMIQGAAGRMGKLLDDLLQLSRIGRRHGRPGHVFLVYPARA